MQMNSRLVTREAVTRAAVSSPGADRAKLNRAREARDAATVSVRQQVAARVGTTVGPQQDQIEALLNSLGATDIRRISLLNMMAATVPGVALSILESDPRILEIDLDDQHRADLSFSVPILRATTFWNAGFNGAGETVAVLDSGINATHPAFGGERWQQVL